MSITRLSTSRVSIPPEVFDRVAEGERIRVEREDGSFVMILSEEDAFLVEQLEKIEDRLDAEDALKALAEMEAGGEEPVPWEKVKADLGLNP